MVTGMLIVTTYITDGKVAKLDFSNQFNYPKMEKINFIYKVIDKKALMKGQE